MWVRSSGNLGENVFQVTTAVSSHFLILGDACALVDCSISAVSERLIEGCEEVLGENGTVDFLLLTHADYDTTGGVYALRQRYPEVELIVSPQISELLGEKKNLEEFYNQNKVFAESMNVEFDIALDDWCTSLAVTRIMGDGDAIDLGEDVVVKMISSPGFKDEAVAYFVQPDAALACCESIGGYGGRELVMNCFTTDYSTYINSLQKLSALDVKILGFPHHGALTGELVNNFFMDAQSKALEFRQAVTARIEQGEIVEEIVAAMLEDWQAQNIAPRGPFKGEQEKTLRDMVKSIAALQERSTAPEA
jgi:glyoxylase-like metal-dependent hydrolase (beta-lactamase superfamily II)